MKLEVINPLTRQTIETYSVTDLSMLDFQEWKDESEVTIHLNCLLNIARDLNSTDSETQAPTSNPKKVNFYLPDPLIENVFAQLAKSQTDTEEPPDQFADRLNEVVDKASMPELKSSTILIAIVLEILQNHHQRSDYKVKISDG